MAPFLQPDLLPFLLRPGARQRNDRSAFEGSLWRDAPPLDLPPGLSIQWLGTAGFRIAWQGTSLLVDPFVTRRPFGELLANRPLRPDEGLVEALVAPSDAVLVGHTHFDHVLDLPALVRRDGSTAYGSPSLRNLLAAAGLGERAVVPEPHRAYEIGPFVVRFVPSVHSKLVLGWKVPMEGELSCTELEGLGYRAYKCGQVYGIHVQAGDFSLYHQGSADLVDEELRYQADLFLCGIAGRGFTSRFLPRVLSRLQPKAILPHHFDNFFLPVRDELGFSLNVNYGGFLEEVAAVDPSLPVRALGLLETVGGGGRERVAAPHPATGA